MAEFQKVMANAKRMCDTVCGCANCPAQSKCIDDYSVSRQHFIEEFETIVEQWAAEHPVKTNRMVLEEMRPNINLEVFCPRHAGMQQDCYPNALCKNCRQKFLDAEYKGGAKDEL